MLVGFDTEFNSERLVSVSADIKHLDASCLRPVCACLHFEDGRELRLAENFEQLQAFFDDPRYCFVVHNAQAEWKFCKAAGLRFPKRHFDTFLAAVMVLHASAFNLVGGVYKYASLANMMAKYHLPFIAGGEKDEIRNAILKNEHVERFGMARVLDYCMNDAKATLALFAALQKDLKEQCGPRAQSNLFDVYQPYALAMAEASWKGLRLDQSAWERLTAIAPNYRRQRVAVMRVRLRPRRRRYWWTWLSKDDPADRPGTGIKDYFTIYDFVKAHQHFNDPEWDGDPLTPNCNPSCGRRPVSARGLTRFAPIEKLCCLPFKNSARFLPFLQTSLKSLNERQSIWR